VKLSLDHVVVVVDSLRDGSETFRDAGFVVTPGGRHESLETENALVVFADGTYLELLATRDPGARESLRESFGTERWARHLHEASAVARRFLPGLAGPGGVTDFALRATKLDRLASESRRRGFVMTGPVAFGRERPDGQRLEMKLLFPAEPWLPFLVEDRTPIAARIPDDPASRAHPNGACGLARVMVRAPGLAGAALAYADRFEAALSPGADGAAEVAFGGVRLTLLEGEPGGACGVTIAGPSALPAPILALGVTPEG
jgi:Glyoxalase-like domain